MNSEPSTAEEGAIATQRTPAKGAGPSAHRPSFSPSANGPVVQNVSPLVRQVHAKRAAPGGGAMGTLLEPALRQTCAGRLSAITWFRTQWQRGGALTGYATFRDEHDCEQPVVVKMPVPPHERRWLVRLGDSGDVGPHVYAHGDQVGGYDMAWVVMERLEYGPLNADWGGREFDLLVDAVGRFYLAASAYPTSGALVHRDWHQILDVARQKVRQNALPDQQAWTRTLKRAKRHLKTWISQWNDRPTHHWCHGDLHLGNAMARHPQGPAVLLDFANTHVGHWIEDAVYFEHIYWSDPGRLDGRKLCKAIARQRKELGLPVERNWLELANIRRALLAMSTPAKLEHVGNPQHIAGALALLQQAVR